MCLHKEINFETEICIHLASHGWLYSEGDATAYDRARALFPADVLAWVQTILPEAPPARPHTSPGHRHGNSATTTPQALKGRSNPCRHHFVDPTDLIPFTKQFPPSPSPVSGRHLCSHATSKSPPSSVRAAYPRNRAATSPRPRSAPVPGAATSKPLLMSNALFNSGQRAENHFAGIDKMVKIGSAAPGFACLPPVCISRFKSSAFIFAGFSSQMDVRNSIAPAPAKRVCWADA